MRFHYREEWNFGISHTLEIAKDDNYFAAGLKLKTYDGSRSRVCLPLQMSYHTSTRSDINYGRIKSEIAKRIRGL